MPLISAIASTGRNRMNSRKRVMNRPNEPRNVTKSTHVGSNQAPTAGQEVLRQRRHGDDEAFEPHADVDEERCDEQHPDVPRQILNQKICGVITLQDTMIQ